MKGLLRPDERGQSPDIAFFVFVVIAVLLYQIDISEISGLDGILGENPELTLLMIIAAAALMISLLNYMKRSERRETPEMTFPSEIKWREDMGTRIRETRVIATLSSFLIAAVFIGNSAFYFAFAVYIGMQFAQYLFLKPRTEIFKDALAIVMIIVLLLGVIILTMVISPLVAFLFFVFYVLLFMWLFWGGGLDSRL